MPWSVCISCSLWLKCFSCQPSQKAGMTPSYILSSEATGSERPSLTIHPKLVSPSLCLFLLFYSPHRTYHSPIFFFVCSHPSLFHYNLVFTARGKFPPFLPSILHIFLEHLLRRMDTIHVCSMLNKPLVWWGFSETKCNPDVIIPLSGASFLNLKIQLALFFFNVWNLLSNRFPYNTQCSSQKTPSSIPIPHPPLPPTPHQPSVCSQFLRVSYALAPSLSNLFFFLPLPHGLLLSFSVST